MHCKDYALTRRRFLHGFAGTATLLGIPVSQLLSAGGKDGPVKAEHVILFWNGGGMSHIDTWDPKPGRPTQGEFDPISTSADGIQISEISPSLPNKCIIAHSFVPLRARMEIMDGLPMNCRPVMGKAPTSFTPDSEA